MIEVVDDEQLKNLLSDTGFLLNIDYPTKNIKLHRINCVICNPNNPIAVKPSSKRRNKTGEFWYSDKLQEVNSKAIEISKKRGYQCSACSICRCGRKLQ